MSEYKMTIGLEIHSELKTNSKMFCGCKNDPETGVPNLYVCPVCMGHPGTLPVINRKAVHKVLQVGVALGAKLADFTEFDRKNYFYPDIPKGYQISQYAFPLVSGGSLAGVDITRVHLEEDTARSSHEKPGVSLVDFNRAGVPLMELVTEPVIHSAEQAMNFARELQLLLQYMNVSDANMEKGQMRVEVNISVSKTDALGTKVEVKNINSFKSVERAIAYEIDRQTKTLEEGGTLVQETRGFDENTGETFSQRAKESSHDYRYFPDPDIPKFQFSVVEGFNKDAIKKTLPELPWERRARYSALGLKSDQVETLLADDEYRDFVDTELLAAGLADKTVQLGVNYLFSDIRGKWGNEALSPLAGGALVELLKMIESDEVSSRGAKDIIAVLMTTGGSPRAIANEKGLIQVTDMGAIEKLVDELIAANEKAVAEYKAGKEASMQFLVGQGMRMSKGSAKPELLRDIIHKKLS